MSAMPVMIAILCLMAIAFRYYSAWIAAKVAVLDDSRITPAVRLNDGQNYHPTSKWVLFGHHFAAISGAGPLIGPVLAAQFGYLPGLLWIVIGVCLGGAVQDFLVLVASTRRGGRSHAQIAFQEIGRVGGTTAMTAILFIIVIALAGLGKVVVNALGGESVKYPADSAIILPAAMGSPGINGDGTYDIPAGTTLAYNNGKSSMVINEPWRLRMPGLVNLDPVTNVPTNTLKFDPTGRAPLPPGAVRLMPGSPWGTFTIAATIPIALFVGLYMYKVRPGKTVEASIIGATLTLAATVAGAWVANHPIGQWFNMTTTQVTWAMAIYGFVAAVLPVWVLLAPRDYLSSFLKIGTIALLVIGTLIANPKLEAPAYNQIFSGGGPTVGGKIFPFLFITIMCGAISGFHALVSSGTTPKMIAKESHARTIGYGAMLMEGLVAVVAMIAAASLPTQDYYAMNTQLAKVPEYHDRILQVGGGGGIEHIADYENLTQESLRGRTGGAVTLAVGMAHIFDQAMKKVSLAGEQSMRSLWKYWYHFAIMFEALFILTTIDAGTRIGRFLLQEVAGKLHPKLGQTGWWPGAIVSTILIVAGWAWFIDSNNFDTIWKMFGIANQMLAVIALTIVTVCIVNEGKARYAWVTVVPLAVVMTTTTSAALYMLAGHYATWTTQSAKPTPDKTLLFNTALQSFLIFAMLFCTILIIASGIARILKGARQPAVLPAVAA
ncbi:MAG: carbon starvation protein predicted rane protein [Phycisphaerales bacterium]|nr:carbon starvation protein predicted rane protein [Phycisphaerales bacterium]